MIKYFIVFIISLSINACSHKTGRESASGINVEMFGSWSNDSGCKATFVKVNNNLVLTSFTNGKNHSLNDVVLISKKISIMTTFKPQNTKVDFSGTFLEGVVIINNYCSQPLHKVDNY